jgi:hypothetical protein
MCKSVSIDPFYEYSCRFVEELAKIQLINQIIAYITFVFVLPMFRFLIFLYLKGKPLWNLIVYHVSFKNGFIKY